MLVVHNTQLLSHLQTAYTLPQIEKLESYLESQGTLHFQTLENGLFPAAVADESTGYHNIWLRDSVHVAHAHFELDETDKAVRCMRTLCRFYDRHRQRLVDAVSRSVDLNQVMNRPHIRFNGDRLEENSERWSHAQNDALGYFVWLVARMADARAWTPTKTEMEVVAGLVRFLDVVQFWQDEDSGHWEETRKIAASSIGVATGGLVQLRQWLDRSDGWARLNFEGHTVSREDVDRLITSGKHALDEILPFECRQPDPKQQRRYDAALLFLIYPIGIVSEEQADEIVADVTSHLLGPYGIRRYLGDSYWCADYKDKLGADQRTSDFSDDLSARDSLLEPGAEAQWCVFDPILSVIYGHRFHRSRQPADLERQTHYFNRSLGQLTAEQGDFAPLRCPESYYRCRGRYVPNDITPLLWTQANLRLAFAQLKASLSLISSPLS